MVGRMANPATDDGRDDLVTVNVLVHMTERETVTELLLDVPGVIEAS
jgi:hypothetical protein